MAAYYYDTEFLEGTQKTWNGDSLPTIDLISIGIVSEDGREYYAISKDFNLKEAWNRFDWKQKKVSDGIPGAYKDYWIRENVLKPIEMDLFKLHCKANVGHKGIEGKGDYKAFKWMLNKYGKSNKQIAEEIVQFIDARWLEEGNISKGFMYPGGTSIEEIKTTNMKLYGYYSAYDHVALCWLFGKMINLPSGFPMYTIDLKQILDEKVSNMEFKKQLSGKIDDFILVKGSDNLQQSLDLVKGKGLVNGTYPKQENEHNALNDAKFCRDLHKFIKQL